MTKAVRILLDVNVLLAAALSERVGKTDTASQKLLRIVSGVEAVGRDVQLIATFELLDTLRRHMLAFSFAEADVDRVMEKLATVCSLGPDRLDPLILLGGKEQFGMSDEEDAGILAAAIAAKTDLLVTNNLVDFETKDSEAIATRTLRFPGQPDKEISAIIHDLHDRRPLIVAHPFDALDWLQAGVEITPALLRSSPQDLRGTR